MYILLDASKSVISIARWLQISEADDSNYAWDRDVDLFKEGILGSIWRGGEEEGKRWEDLKL